MHLFLTSVLPFLAHDHASAAAFFTCRHHNFHASIIPEFLCNEERVKLFCYVRQTNQLKIDKRKQYANLYNLFVQTPLMQFSPSLVLNHEDCAYSILKRLLDAKYFTRTLQRCIVFIRANTDLLQALSKVQSLTKLDLGLSEVNNQHIKIIINSFSSLETLTITRGNQLRVVDSKAAISMSSPSPSPSVTKTLRSLTLSRIDPLFVTQFIPQFKNLTNLALSCENSSQPLDLLPLSSSLSRLTDLELENFYLENTDSLNNLVHLSTLHVGWCEISDLSFLTEENNLPHLTKLLMISCHGLSTSSFASLSKAPNLQVLEIVSEKFDNSCLQYLENMVHLRKLKLTSSNIIGDSRSVKTLMQKMSRLQELNLMNCNIGNQGAIAGALFNTHNRLRVLNLGCCNLVDDDLNGIGALKNTLEILYLSNNSELTNEALVHCKDLVKLKKLNLFFCDCINDLSPVKDCVNLEELDVSYCGELTDESFKVFSEEPNSFPNLRVLEMKDCKKLTKKVFEHLAKNIHLLYQLKKLCVQGLSEILSSSESARKGICQLKGLRRLTGFLSGVESESGRKKLEGELMRNLKNLEEI